ncbi:MAG: DUF5071 domain-containing protein [Microscillaceae bacterium]|nr:DUF5071 domain-containing protein [Microscillaceae bacterium]MDW8460412.1 DUF5071 domain-containing protein [Cytophagales bacterium]
MNIQQLIPKHKDDQLVIEQLKKLSFSEIKPIIPELLEWLQDLNWPIACPIAEVLRPFRDNIVPELINVLRTNDGVWKLAVLTTLLRTTKNQTLLKEVERIAKFPTSDEIEEKVNEEAIAILNGEYD